MNAVEPHPQPQNIADAAARLRDASRMRLSRMRQDAGVYWCQKDTYWEMYKPRTLLQWAGFLGLALLAVSALSTIINILGGLTLGMAWIGLFVYFITVSSSTVAGFFCGSAMMMFSATCAMMGTCILGGVAAVYAFMAAFARARGYATPYLQAMQQQRSTQQQQLAPTAQMRYAPQPQGSPSRLPASSDATSAPAPAAGQDTASSASTQLLGNISPGKPQFAELASTAAAAAPAGSRSYNSDVAHRTQPSNASKALKSGGSSEGHGSMASAHRAAAVSSA